MIQITMTRDELFLIKELMPQWQKYADGFVFMIDSCTDGTYEYLMDNKKTFNILNVIPSGINRDDLTTNIESEIRQRLYDEAFKYDNNILCLDTDEYFDGTITKNELRQIMNANKGTLIHSRWIQYTDKNQIRVDGPWKHNFKDRIGSYNKRGIFKTAQMHSEHLPVPERQGMIDVPNLFIAHLQWLCKDTVAVKQYFWKILDYVNKIKFGIETVPSSAYDASVNNFNWIYEPFSFELKTDSKIYSSRNIKESYKYKHIKQMIKEYNIPNLNDWGMGIHE